jgi:hypothetical protein
MMNPHDFWMLAKMMNFGSHICANPHTVSQSPAWDCCQEGRQQLLHKEL